jgi:ATP-dependent DNA helicase RecQ
MVTDRSGLPADCILLYDGEDVALQHHFLEKNYPTREQCREVMRVLSFDHPKRVRELALESDLEPSQVNNILFHLVDRRAVEETGSYKEAEYRRVGGGSRAEDLSAFDRIRSERLESLGKMVEYSHTEGCLMEYLCSYLGDGKTDPCGRCSNCKGYKYDPYLVPTKNVEEFMKEWRPRLSPAKNIHEGGYCLDYYSYTEVGDTVREDKYGGQEGYREWLVAFAIDVIRAKYPVGEIDAIGSVPTRKEVDIVGQLARQAAKGLGIPYRRLLRKARETDPQKGIREKERKRENIQQAYEVTDASMVEGKTILLVDDVYDSGWTLIECARKLREKSAKSIYIFTLARTHHADNL